MLYNPISFLQKTKLSRETDAAIYVLYKAPPPRLRVGVLRLPATVYGKHGKPTRKAWGGGGCTRQLFAPLIP